MPHVLFIGHVGYGLDVAFGKGIGDGITHRSRAVLQYFDAGTWHNFNSVGTEMEVLLPWINLVVRFGISFEFSHVNLRKLVQLCARFSAPAQFLLIQNK